MSHRILALLALVLVGHWKQRRPVGMLGSVLCSSSHGVCCEHARQLA